MSEEKELPDGTLISKIEKERNDLFSMVSRLTFFISHSPIFDNLSNDMKELMKEQNEVMWEYWEILGKCLALLKGSVVDEPITAEWLKSLGFLGDGETDNDKEEYGIVVWGIDEDPEPDHMQILVSVKDQSIWLESYDSDGETRSLIELPGGSKSKVLNLCNALGVDIKRRKK